MIMMRRKQKLWTAAKLGALILFGILLLTPKDIDLSAISNFNPLVTQVQASVL